jgi:hypothetical protein
MTDRSTHTGLCLAVATSALWLASGASAQDPGSAATRSLNTAPVQASPPARPAPPPPAPRATAEKPRPQTPPARTLEALLAGTQTPEAGDPAAEGVILAEGQNEPDPIPMTLGYYVRGDLACDQAWPGDGNLAFATPTAFTLDYGGCEPGPWLQTGPNSWREDQRCLTESGGDAGAYSVTYEVIGTDAVLRTARFALDGIEEQDLWKFCRTEDVPEVARFGSGA